MSGGSREQRRQTTIKHSWEREGRWEAEKNYSKIYREEFLYLLVTDSWISAVEKWS